MNTQMNNDLNKEYFATLKEQIVNNDLWSREKFSLFNHEAGTGKSRETHRILGKMANEKDYRVLYVQMFEKDNELTNTANYINECAGRVVAEKFSADDKSIKGKRNRVVDSQILCITHNMYKQICRGHNKDLIENRQILIIDEFPDLLEKITISLDDVKNLLVGYYNYDGVLEVALMFIEMWTKYKKIYSSKAGFEMIKVDFTLEEFDKYRMILEKISKKLRIKKDKEFINRFQQILENETLFYENAFTTTDINVQFVMLDNNIILDANAGSNHYYKLSQKFKLNESAKLYSYENSILKHYQIKTAKRNIKEYVDFFPKCLERITIEAGDKVLLITDKENKEKVEKEIESYYKHYGKNLHEIVSHLGAEITVDYFGNIIGKNTYRDYNKVAVLKTPYFDYLSYTLQYLNFTPVESRGKGNIQVLIDKEIEEIRKTIVSGEIYQALKRINRDNGKASEIYLFCDNQEVVNIIKEQLPSIQYVQYDIEVSKVRKYDSTDRRENSKFMQQVKLVEQIMLDCISKGVVSIRKNEIRDKIGITKKSRGNFTKVMKELETMLVIHGIRNEKQELIFAQAV